MPTSQGGGPRKRLCIASVGGCCCDLSAALCRRLHRRHVAAFLEQAQQRCKETPCRFTLYAISNCGFPEGHQNELHLRIYEAWCRCAGVSWGGGLGIGGGVILRWMCMLTPLFAVLDTARLILAARQRR